MTFPMESLSIVGKIRSNDSFKISQFLFSIGKHLAPLDSE
jgi:hypothetical protein